jgi:acetyl esterase
MKRGWDEYIPEGESARDPRISAFFGGEAEGVPPSFVLTAEYDCLRDEGESYAHAMGLAGNRVELKRCLGAIHGFITLTGISRLARETVECMSDYLRRNLH